MKIISSNLGRLTYLKKQEFIGEIFDDFNTDITLGKGKYVPTKSFQTFSVMKLTFSNKEGQEIGYWECAVVSSVELTDEEVKNASDLVPIIDLALIQHAWPIFESKIRVLSDLNINYIQLPPSPTKENLL